MSVLSRRTVISLHFASNPYQPKPMFGTSNNPIKSKCRQLSTQPLNSPTSASPTSTSQNYEKFRGFIDENKNVITGLAAFFLGSFGLGGFLVKLEKDVEITTKDTQIREFEIAKEAERRASEIEVKSFERILLFGQVEEYRNMRSEELAARKKFLAESKGQGRSEKKE